MIGELLLKCCTLKSSKSVKGEAIVQNIGRSHNLQVCNQCWEEGGGVCVCVGKGVAFVVLLFLYYLRMFLCMD